MIKARGGISAACFLLISAVCASEIGHQVQLSTELKAGCYGFPEEKFGRTNSVRRLHGQR